MYSIGKTTAICYSRLFHYLLVTFIFQNNDNISNFRGPHPLQTSMPKNAVADNNGTYYRTVYNNCDQQHFTISVTHVFIKTRILISILQ